MILFVWHSKLQLFLVDTISPREFPCPWCHKTQSTRNVSPFHILFEHLSFFHPTYFHLKCIYVKNSRGLHWSYSFSHRESRHNNHSKRVFERHYQSSLYCHCFFQNKVKLRVLKFWVPLTRGSNVIKFQASSCDPVCKLWSVVLHSVCTCPQNTADQNKSSQKYIFNTNSEP